MSLMIDEKDWYIRQIRTIIQVMFQLVFRTEFVPFRPTVEPSEPVEEPYTPDVLYLVLKEHLAQGQICAAEDLLFSYLDPEEPRYLHVALDFYACLSSYDDALLKSQDFSLPEVQQGLVDALNVYGLSSDSLFK